MHLVRQSVARPKKGIFLSKLLASFGAESHFKRRHKIDVNGFESCVTKWAFNQLQSLAVYRTFKLYHWSFSDGARLAPKNNLQCRDVCVDSSFSLVPINVNNCLVVI